MGAWVGAVGLRRKRVVPATGQLVNWCRSTGRKRRGRANTKILLLVAKVRKERQRAFAFPRVHPLSGYCWLLSGYCCQTGSLQTTIEPITQQPTVRHCLPLPLLPLSSPSLVSLPSATISRCLCLTLHFHISPILSLLPPLFTQPGAHSSLFAPFPFPTLPPPPSVPPHHPTFTHPRHHPQSLTRYTRRVGGLVVRVTPGLPLSSS